MSDQFDPEPRTQAEYLRAIWERVGRVEKQAMLTNGRVTRLERIVLVASGVAAGGLGMGTIGPLIAPLLALIH